MVILLQLVAMIDFLEARPELAFGQLNRTKEGRFRSKKLWRECSEILNCVSANCPKKEPKLWRFFYNDYKFKLLKKMRTLEGVNDSGRQVSSKKLLTPLQQRLYNILKAAPGDSMKDLCVNSESETPNEDNNIAKTDIYDQQYVPKTKTMYRRLRTKQKVFVNPSRNTPQIISNSVSEDNSTNLSDEFHYFGLNIASQLRQLPLHIALKMQVKIQNDLCEARLDNTEEIEVNPLERRTFDISMFKEEDEEL